MTVSAMVRFRSAVAIYARIRSGRFVRIWKVCLSASAITAKIRSIHASSTFSWKRSLIELTKMRRALFQRSGWSSMDSTNSTSPVHRPVIGADEP
jgi:hypothetical protein